MSSALFEVLVTHCFACEHTVSGVDPDANHAAMEDHYRTTHAVLIEHIVQHGCLIRDCAACNPTKRHGRRVA